MPRTKRKSCCQFFNMVSCKNIEDSLPGFIIRNKYKRFLVKSLKRLWAFDRLNCCLQRIKTFLSVEDSGSVCRKLIVFLNSFTRERLYLFLMVSCVVCDSWVCLSLLTTNLRALFLSFNYSRHLTIIGSCYCTKRI